MFWVFKYTKVVTISNDFNYIYIFIHFFLLETSRRVAGRKLAFGQRVSKHADDFVEGEGRLLQCLWQTAVTQFFSLWQEKGIDDFFLMKCLKWAIQKVSIVSVGSSIGDYLL